MSKPPTEGEYKVTAGSAGDTMNLRNKRRELHRSVGGIGAVAGLVGFVGGYYSAPTAIVAMFGIRIVGTLPVNVLTDPR